MAGLSGMRCRLHRGKGNCAPFPELNRTPYRVLVDLAGLARGLKGRHLLSNCSIAVSCALTRAGYRLARSDLEWPSTFTLDRLAALVVLQVRMGMTLRAQTSFGV